jgi:16S rRNA (uracil1498-N3)-methyltransferase
VGRVLRHRAGDVIYVTDGRGKEYEVALDLVARDRVAGAVRRTRVRPREPRHRVGLAQAVLKGDKLAQACEGATELGISEFIPLRTARTVGRLGDARLERLRQVSLAAMKSCTGTVLPEISPADGLDALVRRFSGYDQVIVAYEEERHSGLARMLRPDVGSVLLVVGPEGGFEPEEVCRLRQTGAETFTLGPRRLRAETAGVVAAAALLQLLGDLDREDQPTDSKGGVIGSW